MYLYDARYNLKTETTYEKLSSMFSISKSNLASYKSKKRKIKKYYYLVDDDISAKELKQLYSTIEFKDEVWKVIEGSDDKFLISNYGRFKRLYKNNPDGKFIMPYYITRKINGNKNKQFIKVKFQNKYKEQSVSRLVAYHFVDIFFEPDGWDKKGKDLKYKNYTFDDVVVYHKNGLVHDNYHGNLEFLDRADLAKKTAHKSKGGRTIVAIDALTNEVIDYFRSTRHVEKYLPVSKQAVSDSLNRVWKTNIVGGRYKFVYED